MNDRHQTILIVDDEPNVRLVFRTALESAGYTVEEAASSERALGALRRSPVALVLLDLRLTGSNSSGLETLRQLRDAGSDVPVVVVTAHGSIPDAVAAMKLGAIDFLTKPIKPEALRCVVADVFRRHAPLELESESEPDHALTQGRQRLSTAMTHAPAGVGMLSARRALNQRDFERAHELLEETLVLGPDSAEAQNLMGVLRETLGQDLAAYEAYRMALEADPHYGPALDNMRRYCERSGLDFDNWSINPGAE